MLVLAPDPRLGIAPERVARLRALIETAETAGEGGRAPGVAIALPGGPDGVLDGLVVRPDGVLGLAPAPAGVLEAVRETVGAGGGASGLPSEPVTPAAGTPRAGGVPTPREVADELDRLLGLPDPPCTAPRQALSSLADAEGGAAETTRGVLGAGVGSFRAVDADDVRRLLVAFRLGEHTPDPGRLAAVGFVEPDVPAAQGGVSPETRPVPTARATMSPSLGPPAPAPSGPTSSPSSPGPPAGPEPTDRPPNPTLNPTLNPTPWPSTGRLPASPADEAPSGSSASSGSSGPPRRRSGRARSGPRRRRPDWLWGWRGLARASAVAFLGALGLAMLVGKVAGGPSEPTADPTATRVVDGVTFTRQGASSDASCEGHAYGQAASFLRERGCLHLDRTLWSANADGRDIVVAVATVQMPDTTTAGAFRSLVDTTGTGNISDLLREGRGFPGAPASLTNAGYASAQLGDRVVVAEADAVDPSYTDGDELDRLSRAGLALR